MYPGLKELVAMEIGTLKTIAEMSEFRSFDGLLRGSIAQQRTLRSDAEILDLHADFSMDVRARGSKRKHDCTRWVHIGCLIEGDRKNNTVKRSSYSLVLFRKNSVNSPVLRKLHFDYESPDVRNMHYPKPSIHIQICGKASPHLLNHGFNVQRLDALYPDFEQPRIPAMPMSFALLIDWLFTEFPSDRKTHDVYRNKRWINQVVAAEKIVLGPYFLESSNYLQGASHTANPFIRAKLYGL
jgi:hypothetical protein